MEEEQLVLNENDMNLNNTLPDSTIVSNSNIENEITKLQSSEEKGSDVNSKPFESKTTDSESIKSTTDVNVSENFEHSNDLIGTNSTSTVNNTLPNSTVLSSSNIENEQTKHSTDLMESKSLPTETTKSLNSFSRKHKSRLILNDSDSENETSTYKEQLEELEIISDVTAEEKNVSFNKKKSKRIAVFDSDSEPEDELITPHNKSFNDDVAIYHNGNDDTAPIYTTNSKGNIVPETGNNAQKSRLTMLCDSDSDEEASPSRHDEEPSYLSDEEIIDQTQHQNKRKAKTKPAKESGNKKSKGNNTGDLPKKMTPKEAAEQRKEIQSESQRMLREKNISLPYHKPKSHSLQEFLARRPKLSRALSGNVGRAPPSVAIKMSTEQLEIISKKLKEREKEVKEFYKSESESENDENDKDYVPPTNEDFSANEEPPKEINSGIETTENETETDLNHDIETDVTPVVASMEHNSDIIGASISISPSDTQEQIDDIPLQGVDNTSSMECTAQVNPDPSDSQNVPEQANQDIIPSTDENKSLPNEPHSESPMDMDDNREESVLEEIDPVSVEKPLKFSSTANPELTRQITTESYDFNLEDEETENMDIPESIAEKQIPSETELDKPNQDSSKKCTEKFIYTDLDREIENFGNPEEVVSEENQENTPTPTAPVKSALELLREKLANDKPKLSGGPDDVIDLDSGGAKSREVVQLMERFAKHIAVATKKHHHKHKVKSSIVTVESGGDIQTEEVVINVDSDDDATGLEEIPGAKLQKLRGELQKQMEQKKAELWQQKAAKGFKGGQENSEDVEEGEKDILDFDEEEEAEMTDEEDTEDEEIEDDIELTDKPIKKLAFLDQEAEVSDIDEDDDSPKEGVEDNGLEEEDAEDIEEDESESENIGAEIEEHEDSNMSNAPEEPSSLDGKKKVLKRILKPVDDSDEEDLFSDLASQKLTTEANLDSTVTADEDEIPPHQPPQLHTPIRPAVSQAKSISDFLTPISFITSIQNLTSASKSIKDGPAISPFKMPSDIQWSDKEADSMSQKKPFTDSQVLESQESSSLSQPDEPSSDPKRDIDIEPTQNSQSESNDEPPNTQDLLGICSGEFTGVTRLEPTDDTKQLTDFGSTQSSELKSLGQEDMVISQLLDEEELENFKKKFESPVNPISQRSTAGEAEEVTGGGVIDSDDEDEGGVQQKKKRKNQKRIQFSDDESSEDDRGDNEEIDLEDRDEMDDDIDNVAYDSEENEIDTNEGGKRGKLKLADFLEAEAELSESEWGSEDEDEKDLDQLEFELGDTEKFDEEKVKSDLEKIHIRRLLDDDTREVKLLQELLLEDGEMHGTGRQRQFKWKNIDLTTDQEEEKKDDDDIYLDEEESEEQWRKKRHEREMFLKEQQRKSQNIAPEEDLLCTSQLLKIGHKFLQRSMSHNSQNSTPTEKSTAEIESSFKDTLFSLQNKRGSFLNRNDQVLQRVAEYTKVTADVSGNSKKTTKHFLFQSASTTEVSMGMNKKRKASEGTPNVLKKLRLNTNFSPAIKKKREKSERAKKLFNF